MATKKVGYIKQHRSIVDEIVWKWPATRYKIYSAIYNMVNWNECHWQYRGKSYHCLPGQTVTSYGNIAEYCESSDITPKIVRTTCRLLAENGYITMEPVYKSGIKITFLQWEREQGKYLPEECQQSLPEEQQRSQMRSQNRSQSLDPETVDIIEENGSDEQQQSQQRSQMRSTIEELDLKNIKEKGEGSKKTAPSPSHIKIIKAYYQLYQEYTGKAAKVNFGRDTQTIDKYLTIDDNDNNPDKVIIKLKAWFDNADNGTINKNFPLGFFCSQYDEIDDTAATGKEIYDTFSDIKCNKCGVELKTNRKGEPDPAHRCKYEGYCSECNCGWFWYEGEPEHNHDCDVYQRRIKED